MLNPKLNTDRFQMDLEPGNPGDSHQLLLKSTMETTKTRKKPRIQAGRRRNRQIFVHSTYPARFSWPPDKPLQTL